MGFHSPQSGEGRGSRSGLHFPTCTPTQGGEEVHRRVQAGAGARKAAAGLREIRTERPRGRRGCRRAGRGAGRKPKGGRRGGGAAGRGPFRVPQPKAKAGREGPVSDKEVELTPRSSSERKSGPSSRPSCEIGGARGDGGEDGMGET